MFWKSILAVVIAGFLAGLPAAAQTKHRGKSSGAQSSATKRGRVSPELAEARQNLVKATNEYKASLEKLVPIYQSNVTEAAARLEKQKELFAQGIISRRELDEIQRKVAEAQSSLDATKKQLAQTDEMLAEAATMGEEDRVILPPGTLRATAAYTRFSGTGKWAIANAAQVGAFFQDKFGRSLPISAYGQTAVHDRLGFDHRNSIDVAVHPDSAEGQALMTYLRKEGIPYIAFRHAVPGSATGAHIHIGNPSHRLSYSDASR
ncbi:MAG TPA: TolC family protein [Blastocatellia bacterium]|nr:TolC family protein [Blastocatellia bacterium]